MEKKEFEIRKIQQKDIQAIKSESKEEEFNHIQTFKKIKSKKKSSIGSKFENLTRIKYLKIKNNY